MPGIYDTPLSRKQFLTASTALAGSLVVPGIILNAQDSESSVRLALLSDTHVPETPTENNGYRGFIPEENLKQVAKQVVQSSAQVAILNGDAARSAGMHGDYVTLKGLLQPIAEKMPIHIGLGNHDDRANFYKVFPQEPNRKELVQGKHLSVFSLGGMRFVLLDSLLYVNKTAGLLGKLQRDWIKQFLESDDDSPVVFFVHHTLGEWDGELLDFDRVLGIMQPHRKVKAIFCGHAHTYRFEQREHIQVIYQPAIGYNFNDTQPVGWLDATFSKQGVDLKLNVVGGNQDHDGETTRIDWA